jgi:hypothetical protein
MFYADLNAAWFEEPLAGMSTAFETFGFRSLAWCSEDDWWHPGGWADLAHPTRATSVDLLNRIHVQIGNVERLLMVGDSTITDHFHEWVDDVFAYNHVDRARFLAEAGLPPGASLWAVPGSWSCEFADQARAAIRSWGRPDALLVVGGWNDKYGDPTEKVRALVTALA